MAGVLHILLVDPEVMFQVLPSDLLGWLDSLHLHLNMYDQLTASTVYFCVTHNIQIRIMRSSKLFVPSSSDWLLQRFTATLEATST